MQTALSLKPHQLFCRNLQDMSSKYSCIKRERLAQSRAAIAKRLFLSAHRVDDVADMLRRRLLLLLILRLLGDVMRR